MIKSAYTLLLLSLIFCAALSAQQYHVYDLNGSLVSTLHSPQDSYTAPATGVYLLAGVTEFTGKAFNLPCFLEAGQQLRPSSLRSDMLDARLIADAEGGTIFTEELNVGSIQTLFSDRESFLNVSRYNRPDSVSSSTDRGLIVPDLYLVFNFLKDGQTRTRSIPFWEGPDGDLQSWPTFFGAGFGLYTNSCDGVNCSYCVILGLFTRAASCECTRPFDGLTEDTPYGCNHSVSVGGVHDRYIIGRDLATVIFTP